MTRTLRRTALVLTASALLAGVGWNASAATPAAPPAAGAGPSSLSVGPVTLGGVPLQVCVAGTCRTTPAVTSVTLDLAGTAPTLPTMTEQPCATGVGVGALASGTAGATVSGELTLVLAGGTRVALPIRQAVPANGALSITACTA